MFAVLYKLCLSWLKITLSPVVLSLDFRNDDRYVDILLSVTCSQAVIAQSVRRRIFDLDVRGSAPEFLLF
jgi:hypothetical protein